MSMTTVTLLGLSSADANNVWAVGDLGVLVRWNGSTGSVASRNTSYRLYGAYAQDLSNVWAAGIVGVVAKWSGTSWGDQPSGVTEILHDIDAQQSGLVFAVGVSGRLLRSDGTSWSWNAQDSGAVLFLFGLGGPQAASLPEGARGRGGEGAIVEHAE